MAKLQSTQVTGSDAFPLQVTNNLNNESEIRNTNTNAGNTGSSDMICYNDLGSAASYQGIYEVDLGINSSGYTYGFIGKANDAYLFNSGSQSSSFYIGNLDKTGSIYLWAGSSTNSGSGLVLTSQSLVSGVPITVGRIIGTADTASYVAGAGVVGAVASATTATTTTQTNFTGSFTGSFYGPAPAFAWGHWSAAGTTITNNIAYNSTVSRLGLGIYKFAFSTAAPRSTYAVVLTAGTASTNAAYNLSGPTSSIGNVFGLLTNGFTASFCLGTAATTKNDPTSGSFVVYAY